MENAKGETKAEKRNQIKKYVKDTIASFGRRNPADVKRDLAILRRGAGKELQDVPDLWGLILTDLPSSLMGKKDKPSIEEQVIHQTLTLFALAQQGHDPIKQLQNEDGVSLGAAAGKYAKEMGKENNTIFHRLKRIVAADSIQGMTVHLRGMIKLLEKEGICLDFSMLASDLHKFNSSDDEQKRVRLAWARDYFINSKSNDKEENSNNLIDKEHVEKEKGEK